MSNVFPFGGRRFEKGQSGNPAGLSVLDHKRIRTARTMARICAPRAIRVLAKLMGDPDPKVRLIAAQAILDRAGVKSVNGVEIGDSEGNPLGYIVVPSKNGTLVAFPTPDPVPGSD